VAVVAVGLPAVLVALVVLVRDGIGTSWCDRRFGYLYDCYRRERYWWEVVVVLRRGAVLAVGFVLNPALRAYAVAVLCFVFTAFQLAMAPHQRALENAVESGALAILAFLACTQASGFAVAQPDAAQLVSMVVLAMGGSLILIAYIYRQRVLVIGLVQSIRREFAGGGEGKQRL
jgi:hypothetical protein